MTAKTVVLDSGQLPCNLPKYFNNVATRKVIDKKKTVMGTAVNNLFQNRMEWGAEEHKEVKI